MVLKFKQDSTARHLFSMHSYSDIGHHGNVRLAFLATLSRVSLTKAPTKFMLVLVVNLATAYAVI